MSDITFIHLDEIDSTNTYLKNLPRDTNQPYVAVRADYQTAGRGQRGNTWHSARGENLLCSIRHHPTFLRPDQQFILSQLIALAIHDTLSGLLPDANEHLRIKWPNDIYWDDRKLCGILIEYELSGTAIEQAIIGFGVNVNQSDFGEAPGDTTLRLPGRDLIGATYRPTSMRNIIAQQVNKSTSQQAVFDIPTLFQTITERYVTSVSLLNSQPSTVNAQLSTINSRYIHRLYRLGTLSRFRDAAGDFTATIEGVNPDGTLCLRLDDGTLRHYEFKQVAYIL